MTLTLAERFEQVLTRVADQRDRVANEQLFAALYHELHRLAQLALRRDGGALSISPTTLLHEAYLNLSDRSVSFTDPRQFLAYAARAMRGLAIDAMRRRRALKRGAGIVMTPLNTNQEEEHPDDQSDSRISEALKVLSADQEFAHINEALEALAEVDPSLAELVDLKYFCGLSIVEIAALRRVSKRTVQREWDKARLFLFKSLTDRDAP